MKPVCLIVVLLILSACATVAERSDRRQGTGIANYELPDGH